MRTQLRSVNPFVYARPVDPDDVVGRDEEVARLVALAEGGHNANVYGPRRYGKTSLVRKAMDVAEREVGMVPVLVDLSDVLSVADLALRLERAYRTLRGTAGRAMRELLGSADLSVDAGPVRVGVEHARDNEESSLRIVHALLDLPPRAADRTGRRVLVVLDEFQALLALDGMDGVFRSHIQHQGASASYVFSGSEPTLLRALFEDRARPLYGQAEPIRLDRLPPRETADYVAGRFEATGKSPGEVLGRLVAVAEGHPQRAMLLAHRLWEEVPNGGEASSEHLHAAIQATLRQLDAELEEAWRALSINERRVLAALAEGMSPYASAAAALTGLRARSSAQRAVQSLLGRTVLEAWEDRELAIVDPFLARWVRRRGEPRPTIYVLPSREGERWEVLEGPSRNLVTSVHARLEDADSEARAIVADWGGYADVITFDPGDGDVLPRWARG